MLRTIPLYYYIIVIVALALANVGIYHAISIPKQLEITVFTVGKGRATLVRTPSGKTLLIDTGPDASILRALGTALPEWQRSIDEIILTCTKASYAVGLPEVESHYKIKTHLSFGDATTPYGTQLIFDTDSLVTIISPGVFNISYGATSLFISSTTPTGAYVSDGVAIMKKE